jgi:tRNA A-37 threonylcarbamoyl transferase component Bud32
MSHSMLSASSIAQIEASPVWRRDRLEIFDLPEGQVIVKGQRVERGQWRYRLLNTIAALVGSVYLRAVPMYGGAHSQSIEIARLHALRQAGLPVPDVLHVTPEYFVMCYLGRECLGSLINAGQPQAFALWRETCAHLHAVHAAGQYISQCFGRNVIVGERVYGFIDFEDDPLEAFTLLQAQVRDWMIFFHSTLGMLQIPRAQLDESVAQVLAAERADIRAELHKLARSVGWLRHLPAKPGILGRDLYRVQSAARALHHWTTHS